MYCIDEYAGKENKHKDIDKAMEYYQKFAEADPYSTGYYNIANLYEEKGEYNLAIKYYFRSIEVRICREPVYRRLGLMYLEGKGFEKNIEKAKEYLLKAINSKYRPHPIAMIDLAIIYEDIDINIDMAKKYYEMANNTLNKTQKEWRNIVSEALDRLC